MEEACLFDPTGVDIANGRFAIFGDDSKLAAQGDDLHAAVEAARAKGVETPAIIDLEMTLEHTYVF